MNLLHSRLPQSSLQCTCTGMRIIPSASQFLANIHASSYFVTQISVYLKSIRTSKYALFKIKILRNSDFASCVKLSVSSAHGEFLFRFCSSNGMCVTCICLQCGKHKQVISSTKPPSYPYAQVTTGLTLYLG